MVVVVVVVGSAGAEPLPKVYHLPTETRTLANPPGMELEYFSVTAPSPKLEFRINRAIAGDAHAMLGDMEGQCLPRTMTNVLVSWTCKSLVGGEGGTANQTWASTFIIEGDRLRPAKPGELFAAPSEELAKKLGDLASVDPVDLESFAVDAETIYFSSSYRMAEVKREAVEKLLLPNGIYKLTDDAAAVADDVKAARAAVKWTRLEATPTGTVVDHGLDLEWAGSDNGADITAQGAAAQVKKTPGGGWRLPTYAEAASLVGDARARHDKADCTGGKARYRVSPLLHVTCTYLWVSGGGAVNLTSVGGRAVKPKGMRNLRVLPVRDLGKP